MADPHVLTALRAKRTDIERTIQLLEDQLKAAHIALSHVSAVMQLYERGDGPVAFPVHMDINRLFRKGELWTLCKAALEAAHGPQTTRELALAVMAAKGWDAEDKPLRQSLTYRIVQNLTHRWKRGLVASPGMKGNVRIWQALRQ